MKILVTGFEPFGVDKENPTQEIVGLLPKFIKGYELQTLVLPVVFDECFELVKNQLEKDEYKIVIHLGLAAKRKAITPERVALNIKDATIKDNVGNQPKDEPIIKGGNLALHSTLPLRKIESILKRKHLPVMISNSAGLYVCNNLMYHTLNYIKENNLNTLAGFIHVPYMSEQETNKDDFTMPLYDMLEAIIDSIKTML